MIDNYSTYAIIIRLITIVLLIFTISYQIKQFITRTALQRLKWLLLIMTVNIFIGNAVSIVVYLFRQPDGSLLHSAVNISSVLNANSALLVAIFLFLIYRFEKNE